MPTLHHPFKVGQRVRVKGTSSKLDGKAGKIVGIATVHIAFSYILKMDELVPAPPEHPGEPWECIPMTGVCLELEDQPDLLTKWDHLRREVCDRAGKQWAQPVAGDRMDWMEAFEQGRRNEAKRRGWEGLYPEQRSRVFPGHHVWIEPTGQTATDSGRPRHRVYCLTCDNLIHENTTGPDQLAEQHANESTRILPKEPPVTEPETKPIPRPQIKLYKQPVSKSVMAVEMWEVFKWAEHPAWAPLMCVGHDRRTGCPLVTGLEPNGETDCIDDNGLIECLGQLKFTSP